MNLPRLLDGAKRTCPKCGAGPSFAVTLAEMSERAIADNSHEYVGCRQCLTIHVVETGPDTTDE